MAALVGGFAGALVTGGLNAWHQHLRNRRTLRVAARLVAGELRTIESHLHITIASGNWEELQGRSLSHGEWDEHRDDLAAHLPARRWADLDAAYRLIESVTAAAQAHLALERLADVEREVLGTAAQAAGAAAAALEAGSLDGEPRPDRARDRARRILLRHP